MYKAKILLADDEERMRRLVRDFLEAENYYVYEASDGEMAFNEFCSHTDIDLAILDVMMPKFNGFEVCQEIRSRSNIPIIMLTARSQESDEITGFQMGADEYVAKPFRPKALVARVDALLRRTRTDSSSKLEAGGIMIDKDAHTVYVDNVEVYMSLKEYELLLYMIENKGITLSREKILDNVWNYDYYGDARTIDTHVTKLRKKLGPLGDLLQTVRGVGYKFEVTK
ncbi:MAG: response regulator transcription factor [Clostridia bacterium]|nr:response regulator transcription factor [Clostridia bacterium]